MTAEQIKKDIQEYGLSQWFNSKGLCSVTENFEKDYDFTISTGVTLRGGKILESYSRIPIEEVVRLSQ